MPTRPSFPRYAATSRLLDMLHYLPAERQPALLHAAIRHLAPQGCLIIRNVLREPNWRFHVTRLEEFFLRASGWIPDGAQHYPTADELRVPLEDAGLDVRIEPLRGRTPFNSYLIVARRPLLTADSVAIDVPLFRFTGAKAGIVPISCYTCRRSRSDCCGTPPPFPQVCNTV